MQNVPDSRTPSFLSYRIIDTLQTTSIAVTAWVYLIRHHGELEIATKITPYVYRPILVLLLL